MSRKTRISFICHGNICRSPMAEYIMKSLVQAAHMDSDYIISSAAVSYEEIGNGIYPPAARKLREEGISFGPHSAHRISADEASEQDLLVIMDRSNEELLKGIISPDDYGKIHYLMEYAGFPGRNVSDPWYTRDFGQAYRDIRRGCEGLWQMLHN